MMMMMMMMMMIIINNNNNNNNFIYMSMRFSIAANWGHLKRVTIITTMYKLNF